MSATSPSTPAEVNGSPRDFPHFPQLPQLDFNLWGNTLAHCPHSSPIGEWGQLGTVSCASAGGPKRPQSKKDLT